MKLALPKLSHATRRDLVVFLKMLTPLFFILLVSLNFRTFVVNAVMANLAINLGIIAAASYGVVLILLRLVSTQADFRVIERFGIEAKQGVYMKVLLEQPWLKRRYVRHYLSHIANTGGTLASQMDQNAIENELHALQSEYDSKLELPQFLVGFMIAMGLLGTFIGLLTTLTGISGMLDGMGESGGNVEQQFMKLVVELRKPLAGMGIAFSASMFGLITSLMLAVMMTSLRRYISRVMALARNVMHDLTELTRASASTSPSKHLSPEDIEAMATEQATPTTSSGSVVSNSLVIGRFDVLSKKIELLLGAFEASNTHSQKLTELLGFGPRMKEISERTLEEIKIISGKHAEQHGLLQKLIDAHRDDSQTTGTLLETQRQSKDIGDSTLNAIKNLTLGVAEQHQISRQSVDVESLISRTIADLLESQKQTKDVNDQTLLEMKSLLAEQTEQRKFTQNLVDIGSKTGRAVDGLLDGQKQSRAELTQLLQNLAERLSKIEEIDISGSRHLWDIKENFIKLCKSLGIIDLIAAGVNGHALLLETLIEEARSSQKTLVSMEQQLQKPPA